MRGSANSTMAFKPRALIGLVLGCATPPEAVERVLDLCRLRSAKGRPPIRLYKATQLLDD